jgi:hypothetical protein
MICRRRLSLREGLERELHPAGVERGVGAVDADERGEVVDVRILQDHVGQRL